MFIAALKSSRAQDLINFVWRSRLLVDFTPYKISSTLSSEIKFWNVKWTQICKSCLIQDKKCVNESNSIRKYAVRYVLAIPKQRVHDDHIVQLEPRTINLNSSFSKILTNDSQPQRYYFADIFKVLFKIYFLCSLLIVSYGVCWCVQFVFMWQD
ncbi:hypothetical protein ACKWTF_013454 [Chironomus riparius]